MSTKRRDSKGRVLRSGEVQRADGRYMFRYQDACGERKTIYSWRLVNTDPLPSGKKDNGALRDLEEAVLRDVKDGILTGSANKTTVNDLFDEYMDIRIDLRVNTRANYTELYNTHLRNTIGGRSVLGIKSPDIRKVYSRMVADGMRAGTIESIHNIVYQLFDLAVKKSLIRVNPAADVLRDIRKVHSFESRKREALQEEEQNRLLDYVYGTPLYKKWGTLITTLLGTGMRIGEALGLRWSDCDFRKGTINVNHSLCYKPGDTGFYHYMIIAPKTSAGYRVIPMFDDVRKALLAEKRKQDKYELPPFSVDGYSGFIFRNSKGKVYTPAAVFDVIQNITNSYNKKEAVMADAENRDPVLLPKMSSHILRHTFCTRMCEHSDNIKMIQDVMGHKNARTTLNVYADSKEPAKMEGFKKLEGSFRLV